jgi:transcriptional regulator with XRE-family HTH domain
MSQDSSEHPLPESSQHLRSLLKQRGWSQNELSERSNIDKGTVSRLMRGRLLTHENVQRLAGAFGIEPQELLQGDPRLAPPDLQELTYDDPSERLWDAEPPPMRVPKVPKARAPKALAPNASEAEQVVALKACLARLEKTLENAENHCIRLENQNYEFSMQLGACEKSNRELIEERDQAIAQRDKALAECNASNQQLQQHDQDQATSQVVDGVLFGTLAVGGAGLAVVLGGKFKEYQNRIQELEAQVASLQRELAQERQRCEALVQPSPPSRTAASAESLAAPTTAQVGPGPSGAPKPKPCQIVFDPVSLSYLRLG